MRKARSTAPATLVCFVCYTPPVTAIGTGRAACASSTTCESNLCDDLRGHCSAPCNNAGTLPDKACTDYLGAGFVCTEIGYTIGAATGPLGFCAQACARNADCPGEICQGNSNSGANRIDLTCGRADPGSKGFGVTCTPGSGECGTGLCLTTTSGTTTTSQCSAFCASNSDCAAPLASCGTVTFTRPGGGTQPAKACVP